MADGGTTRIRVQVLEASDSGGSSGKTGEEGAVSQHLPSAATFASPNNKTNQPASLLRTHTYRLCTPTRESHCDLALLRRPEKRQENRAAFTCHPPSRRNRTKRHRNGITRSVSHPPARDVAAVVAVVAETVIITGC